MALQNCEKKKKKESLMSETKMSDIIRASLEGVKEFTDMDTVIGSAINTPSGVTVIPVSKITMGIATGGVDYGERRPLHERGFGGGGGTGLSVTPIAFLTVSRDAEVSLIHINGETSGFDRIASLIENSPTLIEKIKGALS